MEFTYTRRESDIGLVYIPTLPISLNGFPIGQAMIDTGADVTILPMELHQVLGVDLDSRKAIEMCGAGGGRFKAVPSSEKITYSIDHSGFRPITMEGNRVLCPRTTDCSSWALSMSYRAEDHSRWEKKNDLC